VDLPEDSAGALVADGRLTEARIDQSYRRIAAFKAIGFAETSGRRLTRAEE
jgi:hypothetical protein